MPTIWKGKKVAFLGDEYALTPGVGLAITRRFEGERNEMLSRGIALYDSGWTSRVWRSPDSPVWRVEATFQGDPSNPDSTINDVQELKVNVLNPSPFTNPYLISQFTGDAYAAIAAVVSVANEVQQGKKSYAEGTAALLLDDSIDDADASIVVALLRETLQGVDHYISFQYVFRHTFNFGSAQGLTADFSNVGSYFTRAELIAEEGIETDGPDGVQIPNGEWLKIPPDQSKQLNQRKQLVYEYWWAEQWSRLHYPPAL